MKPYVSALAQSLTECDRIGHSVWRAILVLWKMQRCLRSISFRQLLHNNFDGSAQKNVYEQLKRYIILLLSSAQVDTIQVDRTKAEKVQSIHTFVCAHFCLKNANKRTASSRAGDKRLPENFEQRQCEKWWWSIATIISLFPIARTFLPSNVKRNSKFEFLDEVNR